MRSRHLLRDLCCEQGPVADHVAGDLVFQCKRAVDAKRRAEAAERSDTLNGGGTDIKSVAVAGIEHVDHIEIVRADMRIGGQEQSKHVIERVGKKFIVPVETIPCPQGGGPEIRRTAKRDIIADDADGIDRIVDQHSFLEGERLAADGEPIVDRLYAGPVEDRSKAAEVTLEEERFNAKIEFLVKPLVGTRE